VAIDIAARLFHIAAPCVGATFTQPSTRSGSVATRVSST
jgi:hypothetical protein